MHHSEKHIAEREFHMRETNTFVIEPAITNKNHNNSIKYFDFGVSSRLLTERLKREIPSDDSSEIAMAKYMRYQHENQAFKIKFDKISEDGDLSALIDGITFILFNQNSSGMPLFDASDRKERAERLVFEYSVTIASIDEEGKCVILNGCPDSRSLVVMQINDILHANKEAALKATQQAKERVDSFINTEHARFAKMSEESVERFRLQRTNEEITFGYKLAGIELITVPARVTKVEDNFLICDIMGYDIPAKLFRNDWSYTAIGKLINYVQPGETIDVCIKGRSDNKTAGGKLYENKALYLVTRLPLLENPWDNLTVKKDDTIKVTCVSIKRNCWFGTVNGMEIEVYGEYAQERGITVRLGETYLCHVYKCDPEMRTIKVRPIEHLR